MALISTSDLRTWMGIEDGDVKPNAKLEAIALSVEDFVESFTNRVLQARTYFDDNQYCYLDGNGTDWIHVPVFPLSYVSSVNIDPEREFGSATLIGSDEIFWYPNGKIVVEDKFTLGRRNVKIQYTAGYAPVVSNTHDNAVSTYPLPLDLKQTMVEICVKSFKEGMTAIHTVEAPEGDRDLNQLLTKNSFWRKTLNKYKAFDASLGGFWQ